MSLQSVGQIMHVDDGFPDARLMERTGKLPE